MNLAQELKAHFGASSEPITTVLAPGRVNIIGEHTDYNDGFVFPVAIDKYIRMAGRLSERDQLRIYSLDYGAVAVFEIGQLAPHSEKPWANYLAGVARMLQKKGIARKGMEIVFTGEIPQGAGLSSSAALEMATAYLILKLLNEEISPMEMIKLCQQAENQFVGVNCGMMDQYISCLGQKEKALLIDCRSFYSSPVPLLHPGVKLVVTNTNVEHSLIDSAYNERRKECERGVELFNQLTEKPINALRDVNTQLFLYYSAQLPEVIRQRAEHVVFENQRVLDGVVALKEGNLVKFGELMYQSHSSLRFLYEVSCPELDLLVKLARQVEGVYGSRMTGGGFGGCSVSLVREDAIDSFVHYVGEHYRTITQIEPEFYICHVVDGAALVNK